MAVQMQMDWLTAWGHDRQAGNPPGILRRSLHQRIEEPTCNLHIPFYPILSCPNLICQDNVWHFIIMYIPLPLLSSSVRTWCGEINPWRAIPFWGESLINDGWTGSVGSWLPLRHSLFSGEPAGSWIFVKDSVIPGTGAWNVPLEAMTAAESFRFPFNNRRYSVHGRIYYGWANYIKSSKYATQPKGDRHRFPSYD